jgi:hypothetical protein
LNGDNPPEEKYFYEREEIIRILIANNLGFLAVNDFNHLFFVDFATASEKFIEILTYCNPVSSPCGKILVLNYYDSYT